MKVQLCFLYLFLEHYARWTVPKCFWTSSCGHGDADWRLLVTIVWSSPCPNRLSRWRATLTIDTIKQVLWNLYLMVNWSSSFELSERFCSSHSVESELLESLSQLFFRWTCGNPTFWWTYQYTLTWVDHTNPSHICTFPVQLVICCFDELLLSAVVLDHTSRAKWPT